MTRVRNADEFLQKFRGRRQGYEKVLPRLIARVRDQYIDTTGSETPSSFDDHLEIHLRVYFINTLLESLNWRFDRDTYGNTPNLVPEAVVTSVQSGHRRYLDYLGFEAETDRPLLIVETKRPNSPLPRRTDAAVTSADLSSQDIRLLLRQTLLDGLSGEKLAGEWNKWLETLKDYVRSVHSATGLTPKRAVITSGEWMFVFLDPESTFVAGQRDGDILVFETAKAIEEDYVDLFNHLEHQIVLGTLDGLEIGELPFHICKSRVARVFHGLRLRYDERKTAYSVGPAIHVAPIVWIRSSGGVWLRVEDQTKDYEVPHKTEDLEGHLAEVQGAAVTLFAQVNEGLGATFELTSIVAHYEDDEGFGDCPGVKDIGDDLFFLVTGENTHYVRPLPTVPDCPFHHRSACHEQGVANEMGIFRRSIDPRAFFKDGEVHHCAHRHVLAAKTSQIAEDNAAACGPRSGKKGQAFCEIGRFEWHLCCRTCAFEEVCTKAEVFHLPCQTLG